MPRGLRADFMHLYWFCRTADDLADAHDGSEPARSRAADALRSLRASLHHAVAQTPPDATPAPTPASTGEPAQPLAALARTIRTRLLPLEPFDALIDAFLQDQVRTRYDRWDELLQYSAGSADPVGRLVLRLLHAHTPFDLAAADRLSDRVCTALQLANFWQDVRRDLVERNRVYLPGETGVTPDHVRRWLDTPDDPEAQRVVGAAILTLSGRTRAMLDEGRPT